MVSRALSLGRLEYKWWVTIVVSLGMLMSMMDSTIVNSEHIHTEPRWQETGWPVFIS